MAAWHADITRVLMYIVYNNRLALPEDWTQNAYSLDRSQMSEVLLDGGGCTRESSKVKNDLIRGPISVLLYNLWYQKEGSILGSSHFTSGIGNHLQQKLQIKLRGESDSNTVELCQLFCPLLQVCNQSRATFVSGLDHLALHSIDILPMGKPRGLPAPQAGFPPSRVGFPASRRRA